MATWSFEPADSEQDLLPRKVVADRLADAVGRAAVVTAPAGYGKTTQVARWAQRVDRPLQWAQLDRGDDPLQLLEDLLGFVSEHRATPHVVVLDNAHSIPSGSPSELLMSLVERVRVDSTVVLIGRRDPALPFARLRADGRIVDIRRSELALDPEDARELVEHVLPEVDEDWLRRTIEETDGWALGLRLEALASRVSASGSEEIASGHADLIVDYLRAEWLSVLSEDEVDFLIRSSGIEHLSGSVCDFVLGRSNSGGVLHRLQSELQLAEQCCAPDTFRVHPVLRRVLESEHERVDRDARRELDRRTSDWFAAHADIDRAMRHAVRAEDFERAEALIAGNAVLFHTSGHHSTVLSWLDMLPKDRVLSNARLCLVAALSTLGTGDAQGAVAWVQFAEHALQSSPQPDDQPALEVAAFRALIALEPTAAALADAEIAHRDLVPGVWHAAASWAHGALCFSRDENERAEVFLAEGAAEARVVGAPSVEAQCHAIRALIISESGDWTRSLTVARSARQLVREHALERLATLVVVTAVSALVEVMCGEVSSAREDAELTRRNLAHLTRVAGWANLESRLALARAYLLLGDAATARVLTEEARSLVTRHHSSDRFDRVLGELDLLIRTTKTSLPYGPPRLTPAELRTLYYLPTNLSLGEIAERLLVTRNTAKTHAGSVYRKLGVSTRGEAVEVAFAVGLLAPNAIGSPDPDLR